MHRVILWSECCHSSRHWASHLAVAKGDAIRIEPTDLKRPFMIAYPSRAHFQLAAANPLHRTTQPLSVLQIALRAEQTHRPRVTKYWNNQGFSIMSEKRRRGEGQGSPADRESAEPSELKFLLVHTE